jgi:hypothetical protein
MKRDICGEDVGRDAFFDTHSEGLSGRGAVNKTVQITMCRAWANSRRVTERLFSRAFVLIPILIVGGTILVRLLLWTTKFVYRRETAGARRITAKCNDVRC